MALSSLRSTTLVFLLLQILLLVSGFSLASGVFELQSSPRGGGVDDGLILPRRSVAEAASPPIDGPPIVNSSFVLAAERTRRKDPLDGYNHYNGGWNISEKHYWTSVGFTAAPLFLIAVVWFLGFALVLLLICCCYCCCSRRSYSYSRVAYAASLILLILFTIAAIIGSVFLYNGQGKFHTSTTKTLNYVVGQSNYTVENLRNFSDNLSAAKKVRVKQFFLSSADQTKIDEIEKKLNTSADDLANRTNKNSKNIQDVLDKVRWQLIIIAAVMLLLAFLGFLFSILGLQFLVSILVVVGWILVTATFVLSGVFLLLHNVVADTCVAMDEWVQHPTEHTALDDILPCVDVNTANESLIQSKQVTIQLVNGVNQVITNISNVNFPPGLPLVSYNQSGPLAPTLCNPFNADLSNRQCASGEVDFNNASQVWQNYVCKASGAPGSEICTTVGRFTPDVYSQITAAVSVSFGLYRYGPFLTQLEDCTFVRDAFTTISSQNCPGLGKYSKWVYMGLAIVSAAVMLSLLFWVIYARERRHRKYSKQFMQGSSQVPGHDKGPHP